VGKGSLRIDQLDSEEILIREPGSGTRAVMEHFFETHRFRPLSTMEMSTNETVKQAVMAQLGISLVSLFTVRLELEHGALALLPIDDTPIMRSWHLVSRGSRPTSFAAEAFRYFILEQGSVLLASLIPKHGIYSDNLVRRVRPSSRSREDGEDKPIKTRRKNT
jgi:DNA-binding transcriptional LysR family regulator